MAYPTNLGERWGGNTINSPSEPSKPRMFVPQPSVLSIEEVRCFRFPDAVLRGNSRIFALFAPKSPISNPCFFSSGSPSPGLRSPSQRPKISNYSDKISSLLFKAINKKNISSEEKYSVSVSFVYRGSGFFCFCFFQQVQAFSGEPVPLRKRQKP